MSIYIDSEFKCYTEAAEGRREVETDFFKGKCREFIEGYRCVPEGEEWTREDGMTFYGLMITPWKPFAELIMAQAACLEAMADMQAALEVLEVEPE